MAESKKVKVKMEGEAENKAEAVQPETKADTANKPRTYVVKRRHDGAAGEEYDDAESIRRAGAAGAHRKSTRELAPHEAAHLVSIGVLAEK